MDFFPELFRILSSDSAVLIQQLTIAFVFWISQRKKIEEKTIYRKFDMEFSGWEFFPGDSSSSLDQHKSPELNEPPPLFAQAPVHSSNGRDCVK